jgi:hypothetical protein
VEGDREISKLARKSPMRKPRAATPQLNVAFSSRHPTAKAGLGTRDLGDLLS